MDFDIDSFSSYFCLIFSAPVIIPPGHELKSFQKTVKPELFSEVMNMLHEMFGEDFKITVNKCLAVKTDDYRSFMKLVVAKCVKICENPTTYSNFILACTLIHGIISASFENEDCFMIANVCCCCLSSVYFRCYKIFFENKKENTLNFYLMDLKKLLNTRRNLNDKRKLAIFNGSNGSSIIENLDDFVEISLSDKDRDMLERMLAFSPSRFFDNQSTSGSSLSRDTSAESVTEVAADSSESTSKSSASEALAPKESTCMLLESEQSSSIATSEVSKKSVALRKDYLYYKNRICDFCPGTCHMAMVTFVEGILRESAN